MAEIEMTDGNRSVTMQCRQWIVTEETAVKGSHEVAVLLKGLQDYDTDICTRKLSGSSRWFGRPNFAPEAVINVPFESAANALQRNPRVTVSAPG